jgi:hypothetical protein
MLEWMWMKRSEELSCSLGNICCSYLVKPLYQPKFCLHLEIPTKIPTDEYQYDINTNIDQGIALFFFGVLTFWSKIAPPETCIFSIICQFLCIVRTYFVPGNVAIYC